MVFETHVKKHPNKIAFVFEGREWTFKEVKFHSGSISAFVHLMLFFVCFID